MKININDVPVHYVEHGTGVPVLAIHGAYSAHEEIAGFVEPLFTMRAGYRRLYLDLPGMGDTPAPASVTRLNDVLDIVEGFVEELIGSEAFLAIGHSFGAHLLRGLARRRPDQLVGLALVCPMMADVVVDEHAAVRVTDGAGDALSPELRSEYESYFVIQTPETAARFTEAVAPVVGRFDGEALDRILENIDLQPSPDGGTQYAHSVLILTGRHDSTAGYRTQWRMMEVYPHATFVALALAGHALPHEQPHLTEQLLANWLDQTEIAEHGHTSR